MEHADCEKEGHGQTLAGIQYSGLAGVTSACLDALSRIVHFGDKIHTAKLLTCEGEWSSSHAFILDVNHDETICIKSGFSSGYPGEGPAGFSLALQLLERHDVLIDEVQVSSDLMDRLEVSGLLVNDIETIGKIEPVRPSRVFEYIREESRSVPMEGYWNERLQAIFPASIPFGLLDTRLVNLAIDFFDEPDLKLLQAHRKLEHIVRERCRLAGESGVKLFSKAFQGDNSILFWSDENKTEHAAKANMFSAVFGAYRNPRAHREASAHKKECLREFLLLNELFLLEQQAKERPRSSE